MVERKNTTMVLHPPPTPCPAGSSGSYRRLRRQLRITTSACRRSLCRQLQKCRCPRASQRRHPLERCSTPGNARQEETCRIPGLWGAGFPAPSVGTMVCARREAGGNLSYPCLSSRHVVFVEFVVSNLVELHVPGVSRIVVGCPAAKSHKYSTQALPADSCLAGKGSRIKIECVVSLPGAAGLPRLPRV